MTVPVNQNWSVLPAPICVTVPEPLVSVSAAGPFDDHPRHHRPASGATVEYGPMPELPDSIAANVADWTETNAQFTDANAESAWQPQEVTWGVFGVREDAIGSPLGDLAGLDVVELGCGTAYFSAQLAYRGARPVGVDPTPAQLDTARRMMERSGITFPLVEAPAERVPLPDASFDLAFSEYGASLWADPSLWVPEAARLLRPGGRLVFLTNSFLSYLCGIAEGGTSETLQRQQFGAYRIQWPGEQGIEYHLAHGDWIDRLRSSGFEIERLIELQAPPEAKAHEFYDYVPAGVGVEVAARRDLGRLGRPEHNPTERRPSSAPPVRSGYSAQPRVRSAISYSPMSSVATIRSRMSALTASSSGS